MNKNIYKKAFTLVELLVVISIIGILATLIAANLNAARSRSRDAVRKGDLRNIQTALRLYYNDAGAYPFGLTAGTELSYNGDVYMTKIPGDPTEGYQYYYTADNQNDTYTLIACLENTSDPACDSSTYGSCSSIGCSYTVIP